MMLEHYALWNQTTTTSVCQRISPHVAYNICIHVNDYIEIQCHNITCSTFLLSQCEDDWMPYHFKESFSIITCLVYSDSFRPSQFWNSLHLTQPFRKRFIVANQNCSHFFRRKRKTWLKLKPPHNVIVTWLLGVWACLGRPYEGTSSSSLWLASYLHSFFSFHVIGVIWKITDIQKTTSCKLYYYMCLIDKHVYSRKSD